MKLLKLTITAIVLMPFFVSSTELVEKTAIKNAKKQVETKDKMAEKDKEAFLTRLLVKPTDKCKSWPQCD